MRDRVHRSNHPYEEKCAALNRILPQEIVITQDYLLRSGCTSQLTASEIASLYRILYRLDSKRILSCMLL